MTVRGGLLVALAVGPIACAVDMTVLYVLAHLARKGSGKGPLHLATAIALAVTLVAIAYALSVHRRRPAGHDDRFLAVLAIVLGGFFALVIVAFDIPATLLTPSD